MAVAPQSEKIPAHFAAIATATTEKSAAISVDWQAITAFSPELAEIAAHSSVSATPIPAVAADSLVSATPIAVVAASTSASAVAMTPFAPAFPLYLIAKLLFPVDDFSNKRLFFFSAPAMRVDLPRKTVPAPNEPRFPAAS